MLQGFREVRLGAPQADPTFVDHTTPSTPGVITKAELDSLEACQNERAWNSAVDAIKHARSGGYPPDWWAKVAMSGMMARVTGRRALHGPGYARSLH